MIELAIIRQLRPSTLAAVVSDLKESVDDQSEIEKAFHDMCWNELVNSVGQADAAKLVDEAF